MTRGRDGHRVSTHTEGGRRLARHERWRQHERLVTSGALAVLCGPVIADLAVSGRRRPFGYLAADSFYYLTVARNWATRGRISFDGVRPTNGFHPLWQAVLAGVYWCCDRLGLGNLAVLYVVVLLCLVLTAIALVLLLATIRKAHGGLNPLLALTPFGVYALVAAPVMIAFERHPRTQLNPFEGTLPVYGTIWSYVNGMESPLVLLALGAMLWLAVSKPPLSIRNGLLLGASASAMILARLDHGAIALPLMAGSIAWAARRDIRGAVRGGLAATALVVAILGAYLAWSHHYAGTWLPVSGGYKSTFPSPNGEAVRAVSTLWRTRWDGPHNIDLFWREAQLLLPMALAASYLVWLAVVLVRGRAVPLLTERGRLQCALAGAASGVLLLGVYDFMFVRLLYQGHWYVPASVAFMTLAAADMLHGRAAIGRKRLHRVPPRVAVLVATLTGIALFAACQLRSYHDKYADFFFVVAPRVRADLAAEPPRLLSFDDGIDAFALGFPTMSGTGLMVDSEAARAIRRDELFALAVARGFRHFSSVVYFDPTGLTPESPDSVLRARVAAYFPHEDFSRFKFRVDYVAPRGHYVLIRADPA
jgi:hypothetical protein